MSKQFIQLTSGWIPVAVLLLFAAALVAGQDRENSPGEIGLAPAPAVMTSIDRVLQGDVLQKLEALPQMIDTLLVLPSDLAVDASAGTISRFERGDHSPLSN